MLEGFGRGVHGGDAVADVAGEVLEGFGGGLQAVDEGVGGLVDELALEIAEGEGGFLQAAAVGSGEVGVQPKCIAFSDGLADVGEGLRDRVVCSVFLHLHSFLYFTYQFSNILDTCEARVLNLTSSPQSSAGTFFSPAAKSAASLAWAFFIERRAETQLLRTDESSSARCSSSTYRRSVSSRAGWPRSTRGPR